MTSQVRFEGWKSHHNIPVGWCRKEKPYRNEQGVNTDIIFSSSSGQVFQPIRPVLEHMQSDTDYTDNQIKAIGNQFSTQSTREKMNQKIWSDDANLPPGWKPKIAEEKTDKLFYLSLDTSKFQSRKPLSMTITKNSQEEAIVKMKQTLTIEDAEENQNLPAGWMDKERATRNSNETSVIVTIITGQGVIHKSFLSVLDMMRSKPAHNENEAQSLKTLTDEKHLIHIQKLETWNDDKPLPSGWKMSKTMGIVLRMYYFFAPNGNQLESRRPALFHMIKENQPQDGINFTRKSWNLEGFEENIYIPQGWKLKENSSKTSNGISVSSLFTTNMGENNKDLPDGWKVRVPEGKDKLKETTAVTQLKPKKEKKYEAVTSKFDSTVQVERRSLSPHGLGKVNCQNPTQLNSTQL